LNFPSPVPVQDLWKCGNPDQGWAVPRKLPPSEPHIESTLNGGGAVKEFGGLAAPGWLSALSLVDGRPDCHYGPYSLPSVRCLSDPYRHLGVTIDQLPPLDDNIVPTAYDQ
jgi:hypothetical protein